MLCLINYIAIIVCVIQSNSKCQLNGSRRLRVPERACLHEKKGAYSSRIVSKHGKVTHEACDDETSVATAQTEAAHDMLGATSCLQPEQSPFGSVEKYNT